MPQPSDADTIAAISTAPGEGGIGIVRISGPEALTVADAVFESKSGIPPSQQKGYTAQYGHVVERRQISTNSWRGADSDQGANSRHGANSSVTAVTVIDQALLLVMKAPKSYTREDMAEISCHGGRYIVENVFELCTTASAASSCDRSLNIIFRHADCPCLIDRDAQLEVRGRIGAVAGGDRNIF